MTIHQDLTPGDTAARVQRGHGIITVAKLELTQRIRDSRWPIVLGCWLALIALATIFTHFALTNPLVKSGPVLYDVTTFLVLALGMLVVPSLTATSINGDREHGVLATLQTTLLTPGEIVMGKLLAAWSVAMVFLATAVPFLVWAWFAGGVPALAILRALLVMIVVLAVICAIGLWFSSIAARPVFSTAATYLTLAALTFGTVMAFGITAPMVTSKEQVKVYGMQGQWEGAGGQCTHFTITADVVHTERTWWLLAANPFVVVADAASNSKALSTTETATAGFRPMQAISYGVRLAKKGDSGQERQECWSDDQYSPPPRPLSGPVWPYGLAALSLIGAAAGIAATRRLRMPVRKLPRGIRIA